jgi:mannose-6-phosphate isomerase-like protein (cupin superfamily)
MKKLMGLMLLLPLMGAEPAGYKYWSASDLKALSKTLAPKLNAHKVASDNLGDFGRDHVLVVHREGSGEAELHETEADVIMVISGEGTMLVGGTMPGSKTTTAGEVRGPSIDGGTVRQKMSPGDIMHIQPKTAHQVLLEPGKQITYFTLKVKE